MPSFKLKSTEENWIWYVLKLLVLFVLWASSRKNDFGVFSSILVWNVYNSISMICLASGWTSSKYRLFEEVLEDQSTKVQLGIKFNSTNNVLKHFLAFIPDFDESKTTLM